jgi:hypothetical protein
VRSIHLIEADTQGIIFPNLKYYVYLEEYYYRGLPIFNYTLMREARRQGALANLLEFRVVELGDGALTLITAERILKYCKYLRVIGHLDRWGRLTEDDKSFFRYIVKRNSFDIHVK